MTRPEVLAHYEARQREARDGAGDFTNFARYRKWRLKLAYDRALQRLNGTWQSEGASGNEFADAAHPYSGDLNLFGGGSLFELLCIARTSIGQRGLANYLLFPPPLAETRLRQEAVAELRDMVPLREKLATLGEFAFSQSKWNTFEEWLDTPPFEYPRMLPVFAVVTSVLAAVILIAGYATHRMSETAFPLEIIFAIHVGIGLHFRSRVNKYLQDMRPLINETNVLREGLLLVEAEPFQSAKLRHLAQQVTSSAQSIRQLERYLDAINQRDKEWFALPSRLLLMGTQLAMAIERWKRHHGEALRTWLAAWAEFEALNALAGYAYENPENVFPELADNETCFEAKDLGHPLLPPDCVRNNVALNKDSRFYVISGSNMSGKSTLLRSIGLNAVLALAGAPVRAQSLRLSGLSVVASLSIVDSLLNGKSKFMAEVDRLKQAIETSAEQKTVLFLIDEIFSGTNSRDRRIAAEAVVRTLVERGGIGALSTHDLALTEFVESMHGTNVHMGSRDEHNPLDFDYLLKPGVTKEANALAIARMAGVPV